MGLPPGTGGLGALIDAVKERSRTVTQLAEQIAAYFSETRGEPVTVAELFPEVGPRAASTEEEEESQHSGEGRNSQDAQIERTG